MSMLLWSGLRLEFIAVNSFLIASAQVTVMQTCDRHDHAITVFHSVDAALAGLYRSTATLITPLPGPGAMVYSRITGELTWLSDVIIAVVSEATAQAISLISRYSASVMFSALLTATTTHVSTKLAETVQPFPTPVVDAPALIGLNSWTGTSTSSAGVNKMLFLTINDDVATARDGKFLNNFTIQHTFGGRSMMGGRQSLFVNSDLHTASSPFNDNRNYVAAAFKMRANLSDGGTNLAADAKGAAFAFGADVSLGPTATNMAGLTVAELNMAAEAGSSVKNKVMFSLVPYANDAVSGTDRDAMLSFGSHGAGVGFRDMILFSNLNGDFPFNPSTTLLRTEGGTIASGIDIGASTITGNEFSSPGFSVSGTGVLNAGYIYTGASSIQIATPYTPASSSAPCSAGQIAWDTNYTYVCVATNTWKRRPIGDDF